VTLILQKRKARLPLAGALKHRSAFYAMTSTSACENTKLLAVRSRLDSRASQQLACSGLMRTYSVAVGPRSA
jgi:hypothetical protein